MSNYCFVTGKKVLFGNNVSNSNRKTKRRFLANLHVHRFWSDNRKCFIKLNLSKKGLRFINKIGIDNFIKNNKNLF